MDALSLEVDQKLRKLRSQYSSQHHVDAATTTTTTVLSDNGSSNNNNRQSSRKSSKSKSRRDKRSTSSHKSLPSSTSSVKTSRISVTYENGRITNLSTNGDAVIEARTASGFVPVRATPTPPPPEPPAAQDEADRRMSHTYYVPPAPKLNSADLGSDNDNNVIIVRELNSQERSSENGGILNVDARSAKEIREMEQEQYINTRWEGISV